MLIKWGTSQINKEENFSNWSDKNIFNLRELMKDFISLIRWITSTIGFCILRLYRYDHQEIVIPYGTAGFRQILVITVWVLLAFPYSKRINGLSWMRLMEGKNFCMT